MGLTVKKMLKINKNCRRQTVLSPKTDFLPQTKNAVFFRTLISPVRKDEVFLLTRIFSAKKNVIFSEIRFSVAGSRANSKTKAVLSRRSPFFNILCLPAAGRYALFGCRQLFFVCRRLRPSARKNNEEGQKDFENRKNSLFKSEKLCYNVIERQRP